jgi:hypothetical protein
VKVTNLSLLRKVGPLDLDGVYVGHAGGTYEVFDPRWWQVWRWLTWWRSRRAKGTVLFRWADAKREVRVWEVRPAPRKRIEDQFRPKG